MSARRPISIRLTDDLESWMYGQVDAGGFGTPSEYIAHLLRTARASATVDEIDAKLIAAMRGPARRMTKKDWAALAERAERRAAEIRRQRSARGRRRTA